MILWKVQEGDMNPLDYYVGSDNLWRDKKDYWAGEDFFCNWIFTFLYDKLDLKAAEFLEIEIEISENNWIQLKAQDWAISYKPNYPTLIMDILSHQE